MAARLDRLNPDSMRWMSWPSESVGSRFEGLVVDRLQRSDAPRVPSGSALFQSEIDRLWEQTAMWRVTAIDGAREAEARSGARGMRRGDIMNAVGWMQGLPPAQPVHSIASTMQATPDPGSRHALETFWRWVCELYVHNAALAFEVTTSLPSWHATDVAVLDEVRFSSPSVVSAASSNLISEVVDLPPAAALPRAKARDLLALRLRHGEEYFRVLRAGRLIRLRLACSRRGARCGDTRRRCDVR